MFNYYANCILLYSYNSLHVSLQWVGSIDRSANETADANIIVPSESGWTEQESTILNELSNLLKGEQLDAVICVAGGWAGGNAKKDLAKNSDLMWRQSVWTSSISATISANHLKEGGVLTLTGAEPALKGTPGMIGYGMAKAAVHQLTKSLAGKNSGLPNNSLVVAILPITLDTPMNRKWMPNADFSTWTPLEFLAEYVLKVFLKIKPNLIPSFQYCSHCRFYSTFTNWTKGESRPDSGSLLRVITKDFQTDLVVAE